MKPLKGVAGIGRVFTLFNSQSSLSRLPWTGLLRSLAGYFPQAYDVRPLPEQSIFTAEDWRLRMNAAVRICNGTTSLSLVSLSNNPGFLRGSWNLIQTILELVGIFPSRFLCVVKCESDCTRFDLPWTIPLLEIRLSIQVGIYLVYEMLFDVIPALFWTRRALDTSRPIAEKASRWGNTLATPSPPRRFHIDNNLCKSHPDDRLRIHSQHIQNPVTPHPPFRSCYESYCNLKYYSNIPPQQHMEKIHWFF